MNDSPAQSSNIRQDRVRKFLITHGILCVLAVLGGVAEVLAKVQSQADSVRTFLVAIIAGVLTLVASRVYRRPALTDRIVPAILAMDTLLVMVQMIWEGGLESGWAASPLLLTVLLPLYSDDRRVIYGFTAFQLVVYLVAFGGRALHWFDYTPREADTKMLLYSVIGYAFVVVGAAVFAGQASLDVVNSQARLQREIDQATAALRKAQAQIVQQAKMAGLGQLTAGVAHEINNPLTFVQTNLTSIERDLVPLLRLTEELATAVPSLARHDPAAASRLQARIQADFDPELSSIVPELLQDTREGLARVQRIISDLRTFSRAESSQRVTQDLGRLLNDAIDVFHRECADAEVVRRYGELPPIPVYPLLLNQVFLNIFRNACDAVPTAGGLITISTRVEGRLAVIDIDDNGPGVSPAIRERIFEPFFTTKEVGQGTGLGLAISYQIIEHHQGRIESLDAPGGGARFRLSLPIDGQAA